MGKIWGGAPGHCNGGGRRAVLGGRGKGSRLPPLLQGVVRMVLVGAPTGANAVLVTVSGVNRLAALFAAAAAPTGRRARGAGSVGLSD